MTNDGYKVLLALGGDLSVDRLCRLLQTIDAAGSINKAATQLKMSYRYALGLLQRAEKTIGHPLLLKQVAAPLAAAQSLRIRLGSSSAATWSSRRKRVPAYPTSSNLQPPVHTLRPLTNLSSWRAPLAGIVPAMEEAFFKATGVVVRHVAAGTGQALGIARDGRVDLVMAHARRLEDEFIASGYGTKRFPLITVDSRRNEMNYGGENVHPT